MMTRKEIYEALVRGEKFEKSTDNTDCIWKDIDQEDVCALLSVYTNNFHYIRLKPDSPTPRLLGPNDLPDIAWYRYATWKIDEKALIVSIFTRGITIAGASASKTFSWRELYDDDKHMYRAVNARTWNTFRKYE